MRIDRGAGGGSGGQEEGEAKVFQLSGGPLGAGGQTDGHLRMICTNYLLWRVSSYCIII